MVVPDELPVQLDDLHIRIVQLADDLGAPVLLEPTELLLEVHRLHRRSSRSAVVDVEVLGYPLMRRLYAHCQAALLSTFNSEKRGGTSMDGLLLLFLVGLILWATGHLILH